MTTDRKNRLRIVAIALAVVLWLTIILFLVLFGSEGLLAGAAAGLLLDIVIVVMTFVGLAHPRHSSNF